METQIKYWVKCLVPPEGIVIKEGVLSVNGEINDNDKIDKLIENEVVPSFYEYYDIWDWGVTEIITPCAVAANRVKKWFPEIRKRTKYKDENVSTPDIEFSQGWLLPSGVFVPIWGFAEHNGWAWEHLIERNETNKLGYGASASDYLQSKGYVRITNWGDGIEFYTDKEITYEQVIFLYHFCKKYNLKLDEVLNKFEYNR